MLLAACAAAAVAGEPVPCATPVGEPRVLAGERAFSLRWTETSMTDGKRLVVSISEQDQTLFLRFRKTGEGLSTRWPARFCQGNRHLQARNPGKRLARLRSGLLRVSTLGRSGVFAPADEPASAALDTPDGAAAC